PCFSPPARAGGVSDTSSPAIRQMPGADFSVLIGCMVRPAVSSTGSLLLYIMASAADLPHRSPRAPLEEFPMRSGWLSLVIAAVLCGAAPAQELAPVPVEGQPLAANVKRVLQALDYLGTPLPADTHKALKAACDDQDAAKIQRLLDLQVL